MASQPKCMTVLLKNNTDVVRFVTGVFSNAREHPTSIMITKLGKSEASYAATAIIESSAVIEAPKPSLVLPST